MIKPMFSILLIVTSLNLLSSPVFSEHQMKRTLFNKFHKDTAVRRVKISKPRDFGFLEDGKLLLTEREAIEMALVNNLGLNVERYSNLSGLWDIQLKKSPYDPVGTFGFNWDNTTSPTESVLQGGPSVTDILTTYSFSYQQPFSTGTTFEASFLGSRNRTTNFFTSLIPAIRTQFQLLVRQDLLRGFGKRDTEYQIEISKNNLDITQQEFKRLIIDTVVQVQDRFWELDYALKDLEVKQKSLEYAQTLLEQNRIRHEVGTAAQLEVVQSEAEVASRREEFIRAEYYCRLTQDQLVQLITDYEDPHAFQGRIIPITDSNDPHKTDDDYETLMEIASEMRPELQQAELNELNLEINLNLARDRLKPSLEAVGGWQQFGLGGNRIIRDYSDDFINAPIVGFIQGGLGDSMSQLLSADFRGWSIGFNFQIPIRNEDAVARNALAQIDLNRAKLYKRSLRQAIALEIRDALTQIQMNEARLEAAKEAVRAANKDAAEYQGNQAATSFSLAGLVELGGGAYFWRIDEVAADATVQEGDVWSFTVPAYLIVDDFESYSNEVGARVFEFWIDGIGYTLPEPGNPGNGTGAAVGHDIWSVTSPYFDGTIMETANVHGGRLAMPLYYDNTASPFISEAERTWAVPENWAAEGVTDLTLYIRGDATNDATAMYVAVEDTAGRVAVVPHPDAAVTAVTGWTEWKIPLADLTDAGVTANAVKKMTIGVGNRAAPTPDGAGVVFIDDIRVTAP